MHQLPSVRLQIAGEGPQRTELEALAKNLELVNVEFVGHVAGTQLHRLISSARFTVLPSHAYETLGKTILESYAWGRSVVASDLGSRRELVHEGETGVLFRAGEVGQLARAISFLAERPQLAADMGAAGRSLVARHYTAENHYAALTGLYEELAPKSKRGNGHETSSVAKPALRIAFIGGRGVISKYSGIETYYEEIGKRLAEMGHEVTVYCRTYFSPAQPAYNGMRLVRLPTIRSKHLETLVHTFLSTVHAVFSDSDIVHYHCLGPALFSFLPRWFGKKTVVTVQGLDWQRRKWGRIASAILRLGERASVKLPDLTMVVSRTLQDYYRSRYATETAYVPNGTTLRRATRPGRSARMGSRTRRVHPLSWALFSGEELRSADPGLRTDGHAGKARARRRIESFRDVRQSGCASTRATRFGFWIGFPAKLWTNCSRTPCCSSCLPIWKVSRWLCLMPWEPGFASWPAIFPKIVNWWTDRASLSGRGDRDDLERMLRLLISEPEIRQAAASKARERVWEHYLWARVAREIEGSYLALAAGEMLLSLPRPHRQAAVTLGPHKRVGKHDEQLAIGISAKYQLPIAKLLELLTIYAVPRGSWSRPDSQYLENHLLSLSLLQSERHRR